MRTLYLVIAIFGLLFISSGCNKEDDIKSLPELKGTSWRGVWAVEESEGIEEECPIGVFFITDSRGSFEIIDQDMIRREKFNYVADGRTLTMSAIREHIITYNYLTGDWLLTKYKKNKMELILRPNSTKSRRILTLEREY